VGIINTGAQRDREQERDVKARLLKPASKI
jgi:hypothetical protein